MFISRDVAVLSPGAGVSPAHRTLRDSISACGIGLHSGVNVSLNLAPAQPGSGIVFRRTDLDKTLPARYDLVSDTRLCTLLSHDGASIGTIEHLMAAIAACGITDLLVEVDGPELPIFDGSAAPFLFLLQSAGIIGDGLATPQIEILRSVRVFRGDAWAELHPHHAGGTGFDLTLSIAFAATAIGTQSYDFVLSENGFANEIAAARTFTMVSEIEAMRAAGLARGGSLANAIVVDSDKIMNPEGLRFENEFVRHKLLDVVGDLALAGAPISGRFIGHRTGHALNNQLLRALFADHANYRVCQATTSEALRLSAA